MFRTILRTPRFLESVLYVGFDRTARVGDEMLAVSVGPAYVGLYPTSSGVEISWGILNKNGGLWRFSNCTLRVTTDPLQPL